MYVWFLTMLSILFTSLSFQIFFLAKFRKIWFVKFGLFISKISTFSKKISNHIRTKFHENEILFGKGSRKKNSFLNGQATKKRTLFFGFPNPTYQPLYFYQILCSYIITMFFFMFNLILNKYLWFLIRWMLRKDLSIYRQF